MTRKGRIVLAIILALVLITTAITAVLIQQVVQTSRLEELRNEALEELERDLGTYDEQSIVLNQTSKANAEELATLLGAELRITKDGRFAKLTLPGGTTIRDVYANDAYLEHIEKMAADYQVRISDLETEEEATGERLPTRPKYTVSDSDYALQTYLDYLNMQDVWNYYSGWGVTVAVIDTGIDTDHPEFAGRISEYSYNATEDKIVKDWTDENGNYDWSLIEDEQGHGTAVTGVLAASMNGDGIVGIAPNVNIIVIKAECGENGTFKRTSDLVFGIYYAIERDVQVVNMSFGTYEASNPFAAATQLAVDSDIVCVAAAGNDGTSALSWPAADPNVIGIGALAADSWELADYSNYGENTNLVAPGTTYTSLMDGKYGTMNGTSLASPVVAGAIALFMQNNPYIMVEDVTEVLYASSYDLGDLGRDWTYGFGALDMYAFLREERGTITFDMLTDELENTEGLFIKGHTLQELPEPERLYAVFDGWYYDDTFTQEYVYYEDKFYDDITLYAKWVNEDDGVPFTYVELEDGTIEIRSYTGRRRFITIPEKIDGKIVSSIGEFAFAGQTRLREVGLPSGLTTIKWYAFKGCSNLVSMYIPENVTSIGEYAFVDNIRLSTIAFTGVSRLKTVGNYAFSGCGKLRTIELPAALESINATAFLGDISLYEIKVQAGNAYFTAPDGVLYNATQSTLVAYPAARGRTYALPEQTISIADCAFAYARIDEVDLNQVQTIGESAFEGSTLETLFLPDTVVMMGGKAFAGNAELSSVHIGSGLTSIAEKAFLNCFMLREVEIPAQVVSIDSDAFEGCGLVSVTFAPNSMLNTIGAGAFSGCKISEITIPASVSEIGKKAFASNPLSRVTFPENSELSIIGDSAFQHCSLLKSITLPQKLNSIGDMAFAATGLETVNVPASVTTLGNGVFAYCSYLTDINIEQGNTVYHDLDGIVYTLDNVTVCAFPAGKNIDTYSLESTVRAIQSYSFAGTVYLRHVNIPEGLAVINEYAFIDCGASTYTLPSTLTNIMEGAFFQNRNLSSIQFPEALVQIAEYAFYRCSSLPYVHIPDNVLQIGRYAFAEDWNLGSVTFGENAKIPRLSYGAFAYTGLWSFTVPANVSTMAQGVFVGCPWLSSVTFAENSKLESISAYMFDGCTNLQSITFLPGSKLTSVQAHSLEGMDNLTSVDFGDAKLENIDNFAFRFCYRLSTLNLPSTVKNVGRYAFYGCKSLSELSLPESLEHIGSYAFLGTNDLDLYLASEALPAYLDENWDHGIRGYYTGVTNVETSGDYKYATLTSGNIAIIEYLGTDKTVDLTTVNLGAPISVIGGSAFEDSTVETIVLPETLTSIQAEAFQYAPLKSIAIPASVTFIGREAFAYTDLESLTFAENASLTTIEQYAFERTDKLTSVTIPASVITLGTGVFQKSGISSVTFEKGIALEEIPQNAFMGTKLTTVTLPDSVKTVNHNAFQDILTLKTVSFGNSDGIRLLSNVFYNTGLESLHIPANVTFIGEYCFVGLEKLSFITVDENNPNYKSVDGLLLTKSGRKLVTVPAGRTGSLTVPISVEEIGFGAFENTALDEVLFAPNANILTFGYRAFFGAKNLTSIHIPASVVSIDYYAFAYCEKLQTVTFAEGNKLKGIYEGAFCGDINLENVTIPDAIVEISDFAFYGCTKITKLPISDTHNLKGIYDYAFAYTSIGGEFTTPETLIDIGPYAFLGTKITKLTIPETNKRDLIIGIGAFEECNRLTEITLPFIGASYEDEEITWFGYIFGAGAYEANQTYVPTSLKTVTITGDITFIGVGGFCDCTSLENIHIPHSVSVLWEYAFYNTTAKHEIQRPITARLKNRSWLYDKDYTLYDIHLGTGLMGNLILSDETQCIGSRALRKNVSLTIVEIPQSVTKIDSEAFSGCSGLEKVILHNNLTSIGSYAFSDCTSLVNIEIPESVTSIGESAFANCTSLKDISLPDGLNSIEDYTFQRCYALQEITLPDNLSSIGKKAFEMTALLSIHIPSGVTSIGANAFDEGELYLVYNHSELDITVTEISAEIILDRNGKVRSSLTPRNYLDPIDGFIFSREGVAYTLHAYVGDEDTITLPTDLNGNPYELAFRYGAKHVTIPDSFERIPYKAFYNCLTLESVTIPDSVTDVSEMAFYGCSSLERVTIPNSVTYIGDNAFFSCKALESIHIPSSVTYMGESAFRYCLKLSDVTFGENSQLNSIAQWTFDRCLSLKNISLPNNIANIGGMAFSECTSLVNIKLPENLATIGNSVFYGNMALESICLPDGISSIGEAAFYNCAALESISIPASVTYLGNSAFYNCTALNEAIICGEPPQMAGAFPTNTKLRFLLDDKYTVIDNVLYNGECTEILFVLPGVENVVIPYGVTNICDYAFANCDSLESVVLPDSVTSIGAYAFSNCTALENVVLPKDLTSIDEGAFLGCVSLTALSLPNSITSIGAYAFSNCTALATINIPKSLTMISDSLFRGCSSLKEIYLPDSVTSIGEAAFCECSSITNICVPNGVTSIGNNCFSQCSSLTSISLPDSLTVIGNYAFVRCTALKSIEIPKNVTCITWYSFIGCSSLESVTLHEGITGIGSYAFSGCSSLTDLTLPDAVSSIGWNAFEGCTALKTIRIPSGVTRIENYTFNGCSSLTEIIIDGNITEIGSWAFCGCESLVNVNLPNSLTSIGQATFAGCASLANITLPDNLTYIGDAAFENCSSLESVVVPTNIVVVRERTFSECTSLKTIVLPAGITNIEWRSFYSCSSLENIVLPESLMTIEDQILQGCTSLEILTIPPNVASIASGAFWNTGLRVIYNQSTAEIPYNILGTTILFDRDGKMVLSAGDLNYLDPVDGFVFSLENGIYTLHAYIGSENTITLPTNINGNPYKIAFISCSAKNVIIPEGFTSIDDSAFMNCSSLESIVLPDSVISIGNSAFLGCSSLKEISLPNGLLYIYDDAFNRCSALESIILPDSVISVGHAAFLNCSSLQSVRLPNGLVELSAIVFGNCSSLNSITIPDSVTTVGSGAFLGCSSLKEISLPNGLLYIYDGAFNRCSSLESIIIPDGVTMLYDQAFYGCSSLKDVNIPTSVRFIGSLAFAKCETLLSNPNYNYDGVFVIDGWLLAVNKDLAYLPSPELIHSVADGVYESCYMLKEAVLGTNMNGLSNVETIIISRIPQFSVGNMDFPRMPALKNVIISKSIPLDAWRYGSDLLTRFSDVSLFVENPEEDLRWDENFPGWRNGNRVVYGDQWHWATFYDESGNILYREPLPNTSIIRHPYYEIAADAQYTYEKLGWDLDGDGIADPLPATTIVNIEATAIISKTINEYTITFKDSETGEIYQQQTLPYGTVILPPFAPTMGDLVFIGWSDYTQGMTVTNDTEFLAEWHKHDRVYIPKKEPSCTEDGWEAYEKCTSCDYTTYQSIPSIGHSYTTTVTQPTCTEEGYSTHTCRCGDSYVTDKVPATGHSYTAVITNPTCTEEGYTTYTCHCGDSYISDRVSATGHDYHATVTQPTCTEKGYSTHTCHCGDFYIGDYTPATGHNWDSGEVTVEPTEETTGTKVFTCTTCGETETETLPRLDHVHRYEGVVTEPTCTEQGYTTYTCRCGDSYVTDRVNAKDHFFDEWYTVTEATCTADGLEQRNCKNCDHFETNTISATGHGYNAVVTPPTCTEDGYTAYTCHCGDSYVSDYVESAGHTWSDWYDVALGVEERSCETCGETESRDKTPDFDVDGNGTVDQDDLTLLMSILVGNTSSDLLFDFDFDGELTIYDGVFLMQQIQ